MTFEEWFADKVMSEGYTTKTLARAAWDAAMEQAQAEDLEVAYMAGLKDASSRRLPEGYVLVPVEPTKKMLEAGEDPYDCLILSEIYQAMIQAAQE